MRELEELFDQSEIYRDKGVILIRLIFFGKIRVIRFLHMNRF